MSAVLLRKIESSDAGAQRQAGREADGGPAQRVKTNTTDATRGQPLAARVLARKAELEDALADCSPHRPPRRTALETALATVYALMTGDLAHPPDVIGRALNDWLERNKHLT